MTPTPCKIQILRKCHACLPLIFFQPCCMLPAHSTPAPPCVCTYVRQVSGWFAPARRPHSSASPLLGRDPAALLAGTCHHRGVTWPRPRAQRALTRSTLCAVTLPVTAAWRKGDAGHVTSTLTSVSTYQFCSSTSPPSIHHRRLRLHYQTRRESGVSIFKDYVYLILFFPFSLAEG
jgi:hypothetical protein